MEIDKKVRKRSCIFYNELDGNCKALKKCYCDKCKFYKNKKDPVELQKQKEYNRRKLYYDKK